MSCKRGWLLFQGERKPHNTGLVGLVFLFSDVFHSSLAAPAPAPIPETCVMMPEMMTAQ
jgi:hypothetical protein